MMSDGLHFKIVVPGWKAESYVKKCIDSINSQSYTNWECQIYLDESDTDTYEIAKQYESDKLHVHVNDGRFGPVHNCRKAVELLSPSEDDVIFILDADDWFPDKKVLELVKKYYDENEELLMTYGSWEAWPIDGVSGNNSVAYTQSEFDDGVRNSPFHIAAPRTMKHNLWTKVDDKDLQDDDGNYYMYGADVLLYTPMLEMAGSRYSKFIKEVIYIYNRETPFNDDKIHTDKQADVASKITDMESYRSLDLKHITLLSFAGFDFFNLKSKRLHDRIEWHTDSVEEMAITTDMTLLKDNIYDDTINVAMLIEPRTIMPQPYDYILKNYYKYDYVFTYYKHLIEQDPNKFKFYPHGTSWIRTDDFKI